MPKLPNQRHELFAQGLARGLPAITAYKEAGYKPDYGAACRMSGKVNITDRVAEIQARAAARVEISRANVLERLDNAARKAQGMEGPAAVQAERAALMDIAKLEGWVVEKKEQGAPGEFAELDNPRDLREAIARRLGVAGSGDAASRMVGTESGDRAKLN